MKKLILTIAILLFAWPCWGATVYTKNIAGTVYYDNTASSCDDVTNGDTSSDLEGALTAAGAAGTLYICAGTYTDAQLDADNSINTTAATQTIEAVGTVTLTSSTGHGIYVIHDGVTITGLTITGCATNAIPIANADNVTITSCILHTNTEQGIKVMAKNDADLTDLLIDDCTIYSNTQNGIWLNWGDSDGGETGAMNTIEIKDCVIYSNGFYGIRYYPQDVTEDASLFKFTENTIYTNSLGGIVGECIDNTTGVNEFSENTVYNNSAGGTLGGIWMGRTSHTTVSDNIVYNNHTNGIDGRGIYADVGCANITIEYNTVYDHTDNSTRPSNSSGIAVG